MAQRGQQKGSKRSSYILYKPTASESGKRLVPPGRKPFRRRENNRSRRLSCQNTALATRERYLSRMRKLRPWDGRSHHLGVNLKAPNGCNDAAGFSLKGLNRRLLVACGVLRGATRTRGSYMPSPAPMECKELLYIYIYTYAHIYIYIYSWLV